MFSINLFRLWLGVDGWWGFQFGMVMTEGGRAGCLWALVWEPDSGKVLIDALWLGLLNPPPPEAGA